MTDQPTPMPDMALAEVFAFLDSLGDTECICGATQLQCGHWIVVMRLFGTTTVLDPHCTEEQADRIGVAASTLIDVLDAVYTEDTGHAAVDVRELYADLYQIMRDVIVPPSSDG